MSDIALHVRQQVPTVEQALRSLAALEQELGASSTYDEIRRLIDFAEAVKLLYRDIDAVRAAADEAILIGKRRIGEEIAKVPKATGRKISPAVEIQGRAATGIAHSSRAKLIKLATVPVAELKATSRRLRENGKEATLTAVLMELTGETKKQRRASRERELGEKIAALPEQRFGVIVADPEWRFEPWSRVTGMDRAADNHYPTSPLEVIKARPVADIAADDCVLFLWTTAPLERHAHEVIATWGFDYKSQVVWDKEVPGTGYWFRNQHELVLVGTRGTVPAPAEGTQWPSVIRAPRGKHSQKPEVFLELVEAYFPHLPKIELNRRGPPRPGWAAWGNEILEAAE